MARYQGPAIVSLLLFLIMAPAATAEFRTRRIQGVTETGTIVFLVGTKLGAEVPVPLRFQAVTFPERADLHGRLLVSLRSKLDADRLEKEGIELRIFCQQEQFPLDVNGVAIGGVSQISSQKMKSGNTITTTADVCAELLEDGLCQYDGSLKGIDDRLHDIYLKSEESAKRSNMGMWRKE